MKWTINVAIIECLYIALGLWISVLSKCLICVCINGANPCNCVWDSWTTTHSDMFICYQWLLGMQRYSSATIRYVSRYMSYDTIRIAIVTICINFSLLFQMQLELDQRSQCVYVAIKCSCCVKFIMSEETQIFQFQRFISEFRFCYGTMISTL